MKKIILTLMVGILMVMGISACSEKENKNADIVIFSQKGCPHCIGAMDFINGELKQIIPNVTHQEYDVRGSRYEYELFVNAVTRFKLNQNKQIGTPLIIVNNEALMGWNDENKTKMIDLLKQKKSAATPSNN